MAAESASHHALAARSSLRYAWYVVAVLTLIYVFSFIDRQICSLLVGPLRRDDAVQCSLVLVISVAYALAALLLYGALNPFLASLNRRRVWRADHAGARPE